MLHEKYPPPASTLFYVHFIIILLLSGQAGLQDGGLNVDGGSVRDLPFAEWSSGGISRDIIQWRF